MKTIVLEDEQAAFLLHHGNEYIEVLSGVIEEPEQDLCYAVMADQSVIELPLDQAQKLRPLVGKLITIARFGDRYIVMEEKCA